MRKRKIVTMLLTLAACVTVAFGVKSYTAEAATEWSDAQLENVYVQGDSLSIVERMITLGDGTKIPTTVTVYLPDGKISAERDFVLSQPGKYKVRYTAVENGVSYFDEQEFIVKYASVTKSSTESSVLYGTHQHAPSVEGLVVRLDEGDKLEFNQIIDLNAVSASESIVECFVTPDILGSVDFSKLFFQFTDIEDSNNYLRIRGAGSGASTYVLAGGNGQPMSGWESGRNYLHIENNYGSPCWHSFDGTSNGVNSNCGQTRFKISYDSETKCVYGNGTFAVDLDNSKYFTTLWNGFKSGKVKLSVWADTYKNDSANFVITKIMGMDLTSNIFEETEAPVITVNSEYALDDMPKAKVGVGYPVPTAFAKDEYDGECKVTTSVWFNYKSGANPIKMQIKEGEFVPNKVGEYAIVYEASDKMGNTAQQVVTITAMSELSIPSVSVTETAMTNAYLGDWVEIPSYAVGGGCGNASVKVIVSLNGVETEIVDGFRPETEGNYTVKIIATDYIGQEGEYSYTVNAVKGNIPVFIDKPILPQYFIAGSEYVLPELYANDYTSGSLVRTLATVKIKDENGERNIAKGEKYIPTVSSNMESVTVTYECNGAQFVKEIPTVIAWQEESGRPRLRIENYFDLDGASIKKESEYSTITAISSDVKWTFANAQLAEDFGFNLLAQIGSMPFGGWKITYTDFENEDVAISFTIKKDGKACIVSTDVKSVAIDAGFILDSVTNGFEIGYKNSNVLVNGIALPVEKTNVGESFTGFGSNKLYLSVEMINATKGASYSIKHINGHSITTTTIDRITPKISLDENRGGSHELNTVLTLPVAYSADVVDPNVIFTVTVTAPDGSIAKDVNGNELKNVDPAVAYTVKFDKYGQYIVTFNSSDVFNANANVLKYTYAITIEDSEAPEIVHMSEFVSSVKIGDMIVIPEFSVNDNVSNEENIVVNRFVLTPTGFLMHITEGYGAVKAVSAGVYEFQVFAMDEAGNIGVRYYQVVVNEV